MHLNYDCLVQTLRDLHTDWLHIGSKSIVLDHIPKFYDDNWSLIVYSNGYVLITSQNGWNSICSLDDYISDGSWEHLIDSLRKDFWIDPASVNRFDSLLSHIKAKSCDICGKTTGSSFVMPGFEQAQTLIGCRDCLDSYVARLYLESENISRLRSPSNLARFFDWLSLTPSMRKKPVLSAKAALEKYPKSVMDAL
jgi:hypothetical protein